RVRDRRRRRGPLAHPRLIFPTRGRPPAAPGGSPRDDTEIPRRGCPVPSPTQEGNTNVSTVDTYTYTEGSIVEYLGSVAELGGEYRVTGPCACEPCETAPKKHGPRINV